MPMPINLQHKSSYILWVRHAACQAAAASGSEHVSRAGSNTRHCLLLILLLLLLHGRAAVVLVRRPAHAMVLLMLLLLLLQVRCSEQVRCCRYAARVAVALD